MSELNDYTIIKKLGSGAFGTVYKARVKNNNSIVAIKVEDRSKSSRLDYESKILTDLDNIIGFPKLYKLIKTKKQNIAIMDYLGPSLEDLFEFCDHKFSVKTVLMLGIQILNRIEQLHKNNYIHRDIKPDNFLIGTAKQKCRIFLIDFGLSKKYILNNEHVSYNTNKSFTGSFRYSSIRNHKGIEQSRRDDLESIGYMLIFFLKGRLPWQGLNGSTKSKRSANIANVKNNTKIDDLCKGLPNEFLLYMKYCRVLRFKQEPDYTLLRSLFISLFKEERYDLDYIYDWNIVAKDKKNKMKESNN
tara:strand:- start:2924 stop:3829 length:906 start_codon:yes stop_codon:yes gene_type:complete